MKRIVVLAKHVPATERVKMDPETGTMVRTGLEMVINPLDLYAVEEAVQLKERAGDGVDVTVISMGPRPPSRPSVKPSRWGAITGSTSAAVSSRDRTREQQRTRLRKRYRSSMQSTSSYAERARPMARRGR